MDDRMLIGVPEAADLAGVRPGYLRNLADKGKFPAFRDGGRLYVTWADLREFIREREALDRLLPVAEAARRVGLSETAFKTYLHSGAIAAVRGRRGEYLVDPESLSSFRRKPRPTRTAPGACERCGMVLPLEGGLCALCRGEQEGRFAWYGEPGSWGRFQ